MRYLKVKSMLEMHIFSPNTTYWGKIGLQAVAIHTQALQIINACYPDLPSQLRILNGYLQLICGLIKVGISKLC